MKKKLYLFSALLLYLPIFAQQVSVETAQHVANIFLQKNAPITMNSTSSANATTSGASIVKPIGRVAQSPVMYAVSQDSVWVLIAADERVTPILAYSDAQVGAFPEIEDMPDGMIALLDWYEHQIQYLRDSTNITAIHEEWLTYQSSFSINQDEPIVRPLLHRDGKENHWKQGANNDTAHANVDKVYNKFCPIIELSVEGEIMNSRTLVGCVAVAMGQVMWYWQWPQMAVVEDEEHNHLIREYDWNNMPAEITNASPIYSVDMIAHLLRDIGISVNMQYSVDGSGASTYRVPNALRNVFGLKSDNVLDRRPNMHNWTELLKQNLQLGFPVIYTGSRQLSDGSLRGHCFVIDGYTRANMFHMNYGKEEYHNGFFTLDEINGEACTEYSANQAAILNVYPNYPKCEPIEISQDDILDTVFVCQNGGGITIGNVDIENYQEGVICSGEYVKLTSGFHAKLGCNLRIATKEVQCANGPIVAYAPQKTTKPNDNIQWCDTWNVISHGWHPTDDDKLYNAYTVIYQLREDTIINDKSYQKLLHFGWTPSSQQEHIALRFTGDKKVFVHYDNTEYLLYDFGAQVGDTLELFGGINHYHLRKTIPHVISRIDTLEDGRLQIYSDAIIRTYIESECVGETIYPRRWIEGIGSVLGIIHNDATDLIGLGTSALLCAYQNGESIYTTSSPYYASYDCVYNDPTLTATEEVESPASSAQKIMQNGQLLILHEGKTYNVMGVEVGQ